MTECQVTVRWAVLYRLITKFLGLCCVFPDRKCLFFQEGQEFPGVAMGRGKHLEDSGRVRRFSVSSRHVFPGLFEVNGGRRERRLESLRIRVWRNTLA